jgi:ribosomal protein L22
MMSWWNGKKKASSTPITPLTEEYLKKKTEDRAAAVVRGGLSSSSIFEDEGQAGPKPKSRRSSAKGLRNPDSMAAALDPDPVGRKLWERRMVIRDVRKRGRLTRTQLIKRQERELVSKSRDINGSVKKLVPLAKQIAGKTLDEAIIQMRFSKKKAAKDIKEHLEYARNQAIVKRGMGLGARGGMKATPVQIKTKDGKNLKVTDPTTIYVDQAWTGRGMHTLTAEYRARGRVNTLKHRTTSKFVFCDLKTFADEMLGLTVLLKEEKTRIRLHNDREEKIKNRKVWVQLPNRPITSQRQYYSW